MLQSYTDSERNSEDNALNQLILERLWCIYELVDRCRRNSFYYLYSAIAICGYLLLFVKPVPIDLKLITVDRNVFLAIAPLAILVLALRYLYLCKFTLEAFLNYIDRFQKAFLGSLGRQNLKFRDLHVYFQRREFTENLNPYLFPRRYTPTRCDGDAFKVTICVIFYLILNVVIVALIALPILVYVWLCVWFLRTYIDRLFGVLWPVACILLASIPLLSAAYFYYTAKQSIDCYKTQFWGVNQQRESHIPSVD